MHLLLLFLIQFVKNQSQNLIQLIQYYQKLVIKLADAVTEKYQNRCQRYFNQQLQCKLLSYDSCSFKLPQPRCMQYFQTPINCTGCIKKGANLIFSSVVFLPKQLYNYQQLTEFQKQIICFSADLEQQFTQNYQNYKGNISWQYFGSYNNIMRIFPGIQTTQSLGKCKEFDLKFRPWYVKPTIGKKNLIIIIGMAETMKLQKKLKQTQMILKMIIGGLSNSDWVGLISFNTEATAFNKILLRAFKEQKKKIFKWIEQLKPQAYNDFQKGYNMAFEFIQNNIKDEFGYQNDDWIIIFIADSPPKTGSILNQKDMTNYLLNQNNKPIIISYSLISQINQSNQQLLLINNAASCNSMGIHKVIKDTLTFKQGLDVYFNYLIKKNKPITPVWVQTYQDFLQLGLISTVSFPVYFIQNNVKLLLGVTGIDIPYNELRKFNDSNITINTTLINRGNYQKSQIQLCDLVQLRGYQPYQSCQLDNRLKCINGIKIQQCKADKLDISYIFNTTQNEKIQYQNPQYCCLQYSILTRQCNPLKVIIIFVIFILITITINLVLYYMYRKNKFIFRNQAQYLENIKQEREQKEQIQGKEKQQINIEDLQQNLKQENNEHDFENLSLEQDQLMIQF